MASFFEDFEEKKKKNQKKVLQIVNPASAVKTSKETKQATKTKTVTPAAKSYVSKNTKRNFAKDYENRKKVTLPSVSNLPSLPSVKTSDGSLRTPIRSIREDRRQVENLAAQRKARAAQLDRQKLFEGDKTLSPVQQRAIQSFKADWEAAKARGDAEGMAMAHVLAEQVRRREGFSGGPAGDQFISPELSAKDKATLNQTGQIAMKQAKLDYDRAAASGNQMAMRDAILRMTALRKDMSNQNLDYRQSAGTDAYGRPIRGISQREQLIGEAMGKGTVGALLSLRETANAALRNQARQRWTADKTPEMVNPDALGQRLMRESMEAGARATQDQNAVEKFLTETAISMGQMLPGMAASAIPGVGPALGAAILSGQAAGAEAFELNERGIAPGEALTRGLISGGIEAATEAIPLARLGKILKGAGGKSLIKNVLGQMGIEGTEESISYTLNYLADKAAQDPEAEWTLEELGRNALAGAVAGGALAGAGSLFQPNAQAQLDNARRAIEQNNAHGLVRDDYTNSQDQKTMDEIDEISKRLGLTVQFADRVAGGAANASIRGNVVTIERNNLNPVRFLYGHEVAHYMQEASPDAYTNFRAVIAQEEEVSARVEEIMAEGGLNWDQALDEVTADYAGTLIENERILQRFIQENQRNKPLLQKLADAFRGLLQKITGKDKAKVQNAVEALELALEETIKSNRLRTGKEARIETRRANQTQRWQENRREDLIQKLIQDYQAGTLDETIKAQVDSLGIEGVVDAYLNGGKNPLLAAYEEGQTRYSFKRAGDTRQAEEMEAQGATRKTIWQATGQTRDAKGNWVEEVDDSGAAFYPQGDAKRQGNPDWVRLKELESKMLAGTITQEELTEANNLAKNLRGLPKGSTLGDYLDHPELFQSVPGIEDTPFRMEDIEGKGERSARGIAVSRDLPQDQRLSTTLHETQHELQNREGRPSGANEAYWAGRADADGFVRIRDQKTIQEANQAVSQAFEALPAEVQERVREMNRANLQKDYDRAIELENELLEGPHGDAVQAYLDADFDMRMAYTPREMLPADAYMDTAGEIEARETQKRMNMTAEERRETMPDLGWDRAVFAEDGIELSAEEKTAIHNELLEKVDNNAQAMEEKGVLAELTGQEFTKGEQSLLQQVAEFFEQQGGQVEREGFGTVRLNKRGIKDSMAHGLGRKKAAAFAAVPEVIKNGVQIDYQPNWKGRSYDTYVIAGEVMIDGEPNTMGVVLIKRAEDSRYYLHEVMAKEKGAPASFQTGATAEAARLPGDAESPSDTSIPQTEGESNEKLSDKALSSYERAYEMVYGKKPDRKAVVQAEKARSRAMDRGAYQQRLDDWMVRYEQAKEDGSIQDPKVEARLNAEMDALDKAWEQIQQAEIKAKTSAAGAIAKRYLRNYNSTADRAAVEAGVSELYRSLQRAGDSARWLQNSQAIRKAESIAEQIVDTAVVKNDAMYRDYENLRKHLRETKLVVSPEVKAEITDYGDFRKRNMGRLKLTSGEQTNVDQVFQELAQDWPGLFNEMDVTNPGDKLQAIADVMEDVYTITEEPAYQDPEYREQAVKDMAASIMKTVWVRRGKLAADQTDRSFATIPTPEKKAKGLPTGREVKESDTETVPDDDYMNSLLEEAEREEAARSREAIEKAAELVSVRMDPEKKTLRETGKEVGGFIYRKFVDSGAEVQKAGKQIGDKALYAYYNQAKAATAAAQNMIGMEQTNIYGRRVGESLADIFRPIKEQGDDYYSEFQNYLLHMHNIDRMGTDADKARLDSVSAELDRFDATHEEISNLTERELYELAASGDKDAQERLALVNQKNRASNRIKPVFGYEVTAKDSQAEANRLVGLHPEFRELARKVYGYSRNLMQYRVDSGLISQELADKFQEIYPHYVPTFRKQDGEANQKLSKNVRIGKGVKKATGGNDALVPLDVAMGSQTMSTVREGSKNRFGRRLLNDSISKDFILETKSEAAKNFDQDWEQIWEGSKLETENTFTVYEDGKAYAVTMTPEMFEAVLSLTPEGKYDNLLPVRATRNANNLYKKLITAYNPIFVAKNAVKDAQDALLYSQNWKDWVANMPKAYKEIVKGGDYWKQYKSLGGTSSTVYDSQQGIQPEKEGHFAKLMGKIEAINLAVEQAPRLAEFMAVVKKNGEDLDGLQEAMLAAADVTTNFGRSGKFGKFMNANFVPFLNPSIQGFDKLVRTVTLKETDRTVKAGIALAARCAALGIVPAVLNYLWAGDEEDYDQIRNSDKNLNYLIPLGDGKWVKIPRGRVLSVFASMAHGGVRAAKGEDLQVMDIIETFAGQVAPINPLESNIIKPWTDADLLDPDSPGKTWYGTDLESQRLQGYRPGERYDESTDIISKAVGKATGLSPKKINYLIDSYTGVVGDLVLPVLTPTKSAGRNPFVKPFVLDSTTSNKLSGDFYDLGDQLKYAEQDGDTTATIAYDYWSKVSQGLSEVNEEIRKMENDLSLDSKAKRKKYRDLKAQANEIIRDGIANVEAFRKAAEPYADQINEDTEWDIFDKVAREVLGAEKALEYDGKTTYEKAQEVVKEGGSYDSYYDYLQNERALDKVLDAESNLATAMERGITGTTLTDAQNESDRLNKEYQDLLEKSLTGSNGWKPTRGDRELAVLESMNLPEEEAFAIWKMRILDEQQRWELKLLDEGGLPEMEYFRYKMAVKHMNGYEDPSEPGTTKRNSKKDMRVPIINSLDITPEQKDILYLDVENWAKSGLYKTPWH